MDVDTVSPSVCMQYTAAVGAMLVDEVTMTCDKVILS